MGVFVCEECNCLENTALLRYWIRESGEKALCSQCDPKIRKWHGSFKRKQWNGDIKGICNKDPNEFGYYKK